MKFRSDINALRALAVTAVVLFHFKVGFVPGGFVGVDVFFVISGYLMTSIIMGRLSKDKFNLWAFYDDRAKRIIPGLLGVCFVLLTAGYFVVEPASYHYLGSTSISALLFFSNFRFWSATSYFELVKRCQMALAYLEPVTGMAVLFAFSNHRDAFASISKDTKPYCRNSLVICTGFVRTLPLLFDC